MAFDLENGLVVAAAAGVGGWILFGWLPRMLETSLFRALLRIEALKRGDSDFHKPDLGDFVIRMRDKGRWDSNAAQRASILDEKYDPNGAFTQADRLQKATENNVITPQQLVMKLEDLAAQQEAFEAVNGVPAKGFSFRRALAATQRAMAEP